MMHKFIDLGLIINKTLIISDLHIGYEGSLSGVILPRFHLEDLMKKLRDMIRKAKPDEVVICGDLKHEFGRVSEQEWRDSLKVLDYLMSKAKVIIVAGNHDKNLYRIARKRGLNIVDELEIEGHFITHGDIIKDIPDSCHTVVIGHEHPAVGLREGGRVERFKCFVIGKYKGKELIVLPSLNLVTEGHDLINERPISPYIKGNFEVKVVSGSELLDFGHIKGLQSQLYEK